jgi:hypothetical protein
MDYKSCRQLRTDKIIVTPPENNKKFTINNPFQKTVYQVEVDKCLMPNNVEKCDYLFELEAIDEKTKNLMIQKVFYVELKGKDVKHAYEQLIATVEFCKSKHQTAIRECHIVHSSSPKISSTAQILKKRLKDKYGIISLTHTNQGNVTV